MTINTKLLELQKDKTISQITGCFADKGICNHLVATGSWAGFTNCLASHIYRYCSRSVVVIDAHIEQADKSYEDFLTFSGKSVINIPAWDGGGNLYGYLDEVAAARFKAIEEIKKQDIKPFIINTSIQALCQPIFDAAGDDSLKLFESQTIEPELLESQLIEQDFERVECVDMPGQFARRGGILDIFAPMASYHCTGGGSETTAVAFRIDFFGDTIESLRLINLDNQHSDEPIDAVDIFLEIKNPLQRDKKSLLDILPADTIIVFNEPPTIQETAEIFVSRLDGDCEIYDWKEIYQKSQKFSTLEISSFGGDEDAFKLSINSVDEYTAKSGDFWSGHKQVLSELVEAAKTGKKVLLCCENAANKRRTEQIISRITEQLPPNLHLLETIISGGFEITTLNTIVISHHEIFGQETIARPQRSLKPAAVIDNFLDLSEGDFVVHIGHGIGKFKGVETIERQGQTTEYLNIEFANNSLLRVPVSSISLVHKYVGATPLAPKLSPLGGRKWQNQKDKVTEAINDMAVELLEMQAKRQNSEGIAFEPDSQWQLDFEQSFPYTETADQTSAMQQIKKEMTSARPMDMLLCGDVGYGKTELAMRAAFKAVQSGKQVAVLVPTTVLCVQHGKTFTERFAEYPIHIETINRFKSSSEASKITAAAKKGEVDILIGTHRLLSKDIEFKDIGLLIIDEEQRFGVTHKEKLKKMRVNVDVLTLTATPIPRTLHLSLIGLRDIATLSTAPLDRRSVATNVNYRSKDLIKSVINRELSREGQVFFLHNRVNSIERVANEIRELCPKANVRVAHGQMTKHKLEEAMLDFVMRKADILVCTTIIESGLDIPNANTIIIDNADMFGLSQLHQLRGRVGRYKYRAFAQLLLPPNRPIRPIAARRLKAIEEYSQLGAGFKIALRDLEIRGAGNILGQEQSGHINLIGYELYCRLLSDAVAQIKGTKDKFKPQPVINLGFTGNIPKKYISSDRQRMAAYRKIAAAQTTKDIKNVEAELKDIFGTLPEEVIILLDTADIRVRAAKYNISGINIVKNDLVFTFAKNSNNSMTVADIFARVKEKITIPDPHTMHLKLTPAHFEIKSLLAKLRLMLK